MSPSVLSFLVAAAATLWTATAHSSSIRPASSDEIWMLKELVKGYEIEPRDVVRQGQFQAIYEMLTSLNDDQYQTQNNTQLDFGMMHPSSNRHRRFSPIFRQAVPPPTGHTLDPCQNNSECIGERYCVDVDTIPNAVLCSPGMGNRCICAPARMNVCTSNSQCDTGEVCTYSAGSIVRIAFCISAFVVDTDLTFTIVSNNPAPSPRPSPVAGVSFDFCQDQQDCIGDRFCIFIGNISSEVSSDVLLEPCNNRDPCLCLPEEEVNCSSTTDCPVGELCLTPLWDPNDFNAEVVNVCASVSTWFFLTSRLGRPVRESPNPITSVYGSGLTLDACTSYSEASSCKRGRACFRWPASERIRCNDGFLETCQCYPIIVRACANTSDCVSGEVCRVEAATNMRMCLSRTAVERRPSLALNELSTPEALLTPEALPPLDVSPTPEEALIADVPATVTPEVSSVICIGVNALGHFGEEELVYGEHRLSRVHCDGNGSCATAGHMVVYNGRAMMMRTYCGVVGCREKVMHVNSPRRKRGMRVKSNTEGLEFTAFAARYATVGEEVILSAAVHIGL